MTRSYHHRLRAMPGVNILTLSIAVLLAGTSPVLADSRDEEIRLLKAQLAELSKRLEKLEQDRLQSQVKKAPTHTKNTKTPTPSKNLQHSKFNHWPHRVAFNADIRYRFEYIDQRDRDSRLRHRLRYRMGMEMRLNENIDIGFRLASGAGNPVSTNIGVSDAFSNKPFTLDKAYVNLQLGENSRLTAGKMGNPFFRPNKSQLLWDNDLTPEGLAWRYKGTGWHAVATWLQLEERKAADETQMFGVQVVAPVDFEQKAKLTVGMGYFDYVNIQGYSPLYDGNARGNSIDANGDYASDFNELELSALLETRLFDRPFTLFADYVKNTVAESNEDTAYLAGFQIGKAKKMGSWQFSYAWHSADADAVVALLNNSDLAGGQTNSDGSITRFKYILKPKTTFSLTWISSTQKKNTDNPVAYDRLQADFSWKF